MCGGAQTLQVRADAAQHAVVEGENPFAADVGSKM